MNVPNIDRLPYQHDLNSDLKDGVYYLGIGEYHGGRAYRCYVWHSPELELVSFDEDTDMNDYLELCKKSRKSLKYWHAQFDEGHLKMPQYRTGLQNKTLPLLKDLVYIFGPERVPLDIRHSWDRVQAAFGKPLYPFPQPEKIPPPEHHLSQIMEKFYVILDASQENLNSDSPYAKRFMCQ